ncbi:MAG TPA: hypothetical protein VFZ52_24220 [Chryseolinea sp.]
MLEQLINLVQQNSGEEIVKNPEVPNEFNNAAIQDVAKQILNGLQGQADKGNMQDIMLMFQGSRSSIAGNPVISQLISGATRSLSTRFGVSPQAASQIANSLIPVVMNQFVSRTNDPSDKDFDLEDFVKNVTGKNDVRETLAQFASNGSARELAGTLGKIF